jgi:hypothetical protein
MCNFRVGQKVVMYRSFGEGTRLRAELEGVVLPVMGPVYTVREIDPDTSNGYVCIRLVEIRNGPHIEDGIEPSFEAALFRPVVERKTSISIFRAMLNPSKQLMDA